MMTVISQMKVLSVVAMITAVSTIAIARSSDERLSESDLGVTTWDQYWVRMKVTSDTCRPATSDIPFLKVKGKAGCYFRPNLPPGGEVLQWTKVKGTGGLSIVSNLLFLGSMLDPKDARIALDSLLARRDLEVRFLYQGPRWSDLGDDMKIDSPLIPIVRQRVSLPLKTKFCGPVDHPPAAKPTVAGCILYAGADNVGGKFLEAKAHPETFLMGLNIIGGLLFYDSGVSYEESENDLVKILREGNASAEVLYQGPAVGLKQWR